jgi:serralysin
MATFTYNGTSANNTIAPPKNYSIYNIDGGAGIDTLFIDDSSKNFSISSIDSSGIVTISGASASNTKLYLTNVEKVSFKDRVTVDLPTVPAAPEPIFGTPGDDQALLGSSASETIDGGTGIDTLQMTGVAKSAATLAHNGSNWIINSANTGADTLVNIERIQFSDIRVALDVSADGHAAQALEFIGVVAPALQNELSVRGLILSFFDQGYTMQQLAQIAIDVNLLPSTSNVDLANSVFHNVTGGAPGQSMTDMLVGYIEANGQANFVATIAELHINVDLVGIAQTGLEFVI